MENETKRKERELKKAELTRRKELAREKRKQNDGAKSKIASHSRTKGVPCLHLGYRYGGFLLVSHIRHTNLFHRWTKVVSHNRTKCVP